MACDAHVTWGAGFVTLIMAIGTVEKTESSNSFESTTKRPSSSLFKGLESIHRSQEPPPPLELIWV